MPWKYSDRFAKVHRLQYSVPVQSEVIWRNGQTLHRLFNTFVSKTVSANFDIFPGFFIYAQLNFEVQKNIPPVPSFVYNSRKNGKKQKRRPRFWAILYHWEHSHQILAKTVENSMHMNLKCASNFLKYSFEKKSKTVSETFFWLNNKAWK